MLQRRHSTYNIRVGRSRKVTGPYLDNMGMDMLRGGGKLVVAANGRCIGPGHFGLLDLGDGVQKFSCHYEADLDRGGRSILDVRALLWKDGWPVAGEDFKGGTFEIESERSGYALELGVEPVWLGGGRGGGMFGGRNSGPMTPIPAQEVNDVSKNWPAGNIDVRLGDYMLLAHQKWTITPVANAGGYPGSPYFKITVAGTDRPLAVTHDAEVVARSRLHRRTAAALADRSTHGRHLADHAEDRCRHQGTAGPICRGRQHADADRVRREERQGAMELQNALKKTDSHNRRSEHHEWG